MNKKLDEILKEIKEVAEEQQRINESLKEKLNRLQFPEPTIIAYCWVKWRVGENKYVIIEQEQEKIIFSFEAEVSLCNFQKELNSDEDFIRAKNFIEFLRK